MVRVFLLSGRLQHIQTACTSLSSRTQWGRHFLDRQVTDTVRRSIELPILERETAPYPYTKGSPGFVQNCGVRFFILTLS